MNLHLHIVMREEKNCRNFFRDRFFKWFMYLNKIISFYDVGEPAHVRHIERDFIFQTECGERVRERDKKY